MPIPHDKFPLRVAPIGFRFLLLVMHYRFFWNPNAASQVYTVPDPDKFPVDIDSAFRISSSRSRKMFSSCFSFFDSTITYPRKKRC